MRPRSIGISLLDYCNITYHNLIHFFFSDCMIPIYEHADRIYQKECANRCCIFTHLKLEMHIAHFHHSQSPFSYIALHTVLLFVFFIPFLLFYFSLNEKNWAAKGKQRNGKRTVFISNFFFLFLTSSTIYFVWIKKKILIKYGEDGMF